MLIRKRKLGYSVVSICVFDVPPLGLKDATGNRRKISFTGSNQVMNSLAYSVNGKPSHLPGADSG